MTNLINVGNLVLDANQAFSIEILFRTFLEDRLIQPKDIRFSVYAENWYLYDKCAYIKAKLDRGKKYSRTVVVQKRSQLIELTYLNFVGFFVLIQTHKIMDN